MFKILIVDDEHMMLTIAKRVLSEKYEVVTASGGSEAIEVYSKEQPDMLLTDLLMPGMSGIELKAALCEKYGREIPTLFMTGVDESAELDGADHVTKPINADELLGKTAEILSGIEDRFARVCANGNGALMLAEIVGSSAPSQAVTDGFVQALHKALMPDDLLEKNGSVFRIFVYDLSSDSSAEEFIASLDKTVSKLSDGKNSIAAGVVFAPEHGTDCAELTSFAEKCLADIKSRKNGGCAVFSPFDEQPIAGSSSPSNLQSLSLMFEEHSMIDSAFVIETEAFSYVYRFLLRYIQSYSSSAYKLLVTLAPHSDGFDEEPIAEVTDAFGDMVAHSLRKSDIMVRTNDNQYLIILPEITETDTERLVQRLLRKWSTLDLARFAEVSYEAEAIIAEKHQREHRRNVRATDEE